MQNNPTNTDNVKPTERKPRRTKAEILEERIKKDRERLKAVREKEKIAKEKKYQSVYPMLLKLILDDYSNEQLTMLKEKISRNVKSEKTRDSVLEFLSEFKNK